MPAVLAPLADILVALALLLLAVTVDWFVTHANSAVPTVNIPLVGDVFGWVHDFLNALHDWVLNAEDAVVGNITDAVLDAGWILSRIAGAAELAMTNLLNLTRHVANVVVVDAENDAKSFATDAANAAEAVVHDQLVASVNNIEATFTNIRGDISAIIDSTIPDDVANAFDQAEADIKQDAANLQNNINTLANTLTADLVQVWGQINPLFAYVYDTLSPEVTANAQAEQAALAQQAAQQQAALSTAVNALEAQIGGLNTEAQIQQIALDTANASIASLDTTSATYQQDLTQLSGEAATAEGNIDQLQNQADSLGTQLTTAQQQINTLDQTQAISFPALPDITIPGSIVVPAAVAGLATVVADIATEIESCMVSVCDGPNNISNLLQNILGGIDLAAMAVFLEGAIKNPSGTAATFAGAGEALYDDADSFINELLSL